MTYIEMNGVRIDRIVANQIPAIQDLVLHKDRDKHIIIDGREGSGKSKFARQLAKALDPTFNIDRIAFNSDGFIKLVKDISRIKGEAVVLDEAYSAVSSRAALSDVNRAMVTLATEMRQLNLYVIIVLPTFFDLDKYFAIWRCDTLFHVYFDEKGNRGRYVIFPFEDKLQLYVRGKKTYNYGIWRSPYPPCLFPKDDPIDEAEYNKRKMSAFRGRRLSLKDKEWRARTCKLMNFLNKIYKLSLREIGQIIDLSEENAQKTLENWRNEARKDENIILKLNPND